MTHMDVVATLLDEVEEELEACGILGLYHFTWTLRGLRAGVPDEEFPDICRAAYAHLRSRHALTLVWVRWPMRVEEASPVEPGTPLNFDIDPDAPVSTPMLALVPSELVSWDHEG